MEKTVIRLEVLFCLLIEKTEDRTVTNIAKRLNVSKSTVSRVVSYFIEEGILQQWEMTLTFYGKVLARKYYEQRQVLLQWLSKSSSIQIEKREKEVVHLIASLSDELLEVFITSVMPDEGEFLQENHSELQGRTLESLLEDGEYAVAFTIYRHNKTENTHISMANDGFYHPAKLEVKDGVGMLYLTPKKIVKRLPGGIKLSGQVDEITYYAKQIFKSAEFINGLWRLPVNSMRFSYNKEEHLLQGTLTLRMKCTAGRMYMPESVAMISILLVIK